MVSFYQTSSLSSYEYSKLAPNLLVRIALPLLLTVLASKTTAEAPPAIHVSLQEEVLNGTVLVDLAAERHTLAALARLSPPLEASALRFELLSSYFKVSIRVRVQQIQYSILV